MLFDILSWVILGLVVLATLIGTLLAVMDKINRGRYGWVEWHWIWLTALVSSGIGILAWVITGFLLTGIVASTQDYREVETKVQPLASLQTTTSPDGSFHGNIFLSIGEFGETREISYVAGNGEVGYEVRQVSADNAKIFEGDAPPTIQSHYWEKRDDSLIHHAVAESVTYSFHVPPGSVVNTYEVAP